MVCEGQEEALKFVLKPGGKTERQIEIQNRSNTLIKKLRVESSCDCLGAAPLGDSIGLGSFQTARLLLLLDLSADAQYRGGFAPELRAFDGDYLVLTLKLDVEVRE